MHYEQLSREALVAALMGPIPTDLAEPAEAVKPRCEPTAQELPPAAPYAAWPRHALDAALDLDLPPPVRHRLSAARELMLRTLGQRLASAPLMNSPQSVTDWLVLQCCGLQHEVFWVLFLDGQHRLISAEPMFRGTLAQTSVYPREVVKRALALNAAALILVHNHPSGDPKPSRDDIEMTREIKAASEALGITIHDHLVIGRKGHASFRSLGLL